VRLDPDDPNWPDLLSHPAEDGRDEMALERHLCEVAERAREVTPDDATTADAESLRDAAEIVGLAHDFGKATEWFQQHVADDRPDPDGEPTHHSPLGSRVAYYALRDRGFAPKTRFAGLVAVAKHHGDLPDASTFLESLDEDVRWKPGSAGYSYHAARQASNVDGRVNEFADAVFDELCDDGSWRDFRDRLYASVDAELDGRADELDSSDGALRNLLLEDFYRVAGRRRKPDQTARSGEAYLDELRLFGALTFADKTHAAGIEDEDDRLHADPLTADAVEDYIDGLPDADGDLESSLNDLRGAIQDRIRGEDDPDPVQEFVDSDRSVATLTLPTGYGKTLTGLLAAARIREETGGERIVYALPFTSIVDQTADVLEGVTDESGEGRAFSIHHHLAETVTLPADESDDSPGEDETDERAREDVMLAESWRAGVTLTTFVQLFESLAGPRNGQSTKLPALNDAVVVIDEPQALPLRWWPLVQRMLRVLVSEFGATVLLMTATQPRLVEDADELLSTEALTALEGEQFETVPERVEYRFDPTALPRTGENADDLLGHDEAADRLAGTVLETRDASLAICNTIDSARDLFEALTETLEAVTGEEPVDVAEEYETLLDGVGAPPITDESGDPSRVRENVVQHLADECRATRPVVLHLSTRIRPCDRRFLLAVADDLTEMDVPFTLVSTQLIEAGVDVSFDRVFRDFAPLDSVVQAAGRCNRSFERAPDTGTVTVWQLEAPDDVETPPSEAVYAKTSNKTELDLLSATRTALERHVDGGRVDERTVAHDAVTSYHESIGERVAALAPDNDLLQSFERAEARRLRRASLIDRQLSYEVYVCRTGGERNLAQSVKSDAAAANWERVEQKRKRLADIRISVPVYSRDSEAAGILHRKLERFTNDEKDAERILDATDDTGLFHASLGIQPLEAGVEDRFF
jgi:CRISPR-associated endonuclease Cas3-HD